MQLAFHRQHSPKVAQHFGVVRVKLRGAAKLSLGGSQIASLRKVNPALGVLPRSVLRRQVYGQRRRQQKNCSSCAGSAASRWLVMDFHSFVEGLRGASRISRRFPASRQANGEQRRADGRRRLIGSLRRFQLFQANDFL